MPELDLRALILFFAILLDWVMGDPKQIYRHVFHPVQFMGELLAWFEARFNRPGLRFGQAKRRGLFVLILYLLIWVVFAAALSLMFDLFGVWGWLLEMIVVAVFLSARSLYEHVWDVCNALKFKTVSEARDVVGHIVGRDPGALDEYGVARAAIESGAENLSDGFVAPLMFYLVAGLPGLFFYKAVNTADSMIGHKTHRFIAFGWAAARLDDLLNWIPARFSGGLIVVLAQIYCGAGLASWRVMRRDARKHSSPNSGWPEAAMAGALGIAVAGPRVYKDMMKQDPWINARGRLDANAEDIWQALQLMRASVFCVLPLVAAVGGFVFYFYR